jgi:hypothetical protein
VTRHTILHHQRCAPLQHPKPALCRPRWCMRRLQGPTGKTRVRSRCAGAFVI